MARKAEIPMVHHFPLTKFRRRVGEIVNRVHRNKEYVIVQRGGLPIAAMMDIDEFEDYLELRDSAVHRDIEQSRRDVEAGRVRPAAELLRELQRRPERRRRRAAGASKKK